MTLSTLPLPRDEPKIGSRLRVFDARPRLGGGSDRCRTRGASSTTTDAAQAALSSGGQWQWRDWQPAEVQPRSLQKRLLLTAVSGRHLGVSRGQ